MNQNVTADPSTQTVYQNWREHFVRPMLIGALVFGLLALIPALVNARSYILSAVFICAYLAVVIITVADSPYWLKMGIFLFVAYALGVSELFSTGILGNALFFFLGFIVFSTIMFSPRAGLIATAITLFTLVLTAWLTLSGRLILMNPDAPPADLTDWLSAAATAVLFSATIILGLRQLQIEFIEAQRKSASSVHEVEAERAKLEERIKERTLQLKAVNEVGQAANAILDPEELAERAVNLISDRFGFYYAAIFLLDEKGEWAELHAATGEAGRLLKESKHRLRIGGNSMVGSAISTATARLAQEVGMESVRFENPLLPYTRSEVALPLIAGDRVLGALDVQSTQEAAFGPQEVETLQSMANQVAIALENARLFQESRRNIEELQAIQQHYMFGAWKPAAKGDELEYKVGDDEIPADASNLDVPLTLREEVIGQIHLAGDGEWTPEQRNLVEAIAAQAAQALENARLVEQSHASAARDHLLAEITGKIWASPTIDSILQSAVRELGRALDVSEAVIELEVNGNE
jgi:GAF domain-containing protein